VKRRHERRAVSILDACADQQLFGPWFRDSSTWSAWRVFLRALFGLPVDEIARNAAHLLVIMNCGAIFKRTPLEKWTQQAQFAYAAGGGDARP
jgi:hypothetical protein